MKLGRILDFAEKILFCLTKERKKEVFEVLVKKLNSLR
tara:strand:+ start:77 stop:190 length:114 start_codon:yes stop_codon:yes gene_type:complete